MPPYINVETSAWQLAHDMRTYGTLQPHAFLHPPPAAALGDAPYYIDRGHTAWCMHAQTRAFAAELTHDPASGFKDARTQKVQACVQNSIEIMNAAAGADWGELFVLRLRDADTPDAERIEYTLEFCSRVDEDSDYESVSGLNTAATVASRLKVTIEASDQHTLLVFMDAGNTIICLRCMHLATLLRACALLIAQQLACLCGSNETVGLGGIPQAPETKRIYKRIFNDFKTNDFLVYGDMQIGTLRNGSATDVPQSLVNVAEMLWRWHDKSAFMCHEALPAQIRRYKADVCECGTSRKLPHGVTAHGEVPGHAADAQACINACNGSAQPAHLFPAAALAHEPYSSANETAVEFTEQLPQFANSLVTQKPADSPWSASNIAACVGHAIHLMNSAAGENWGGLFRLNVRYPLRLHEYVNVFLVQFSSNMVGEQDEFTPPANQVQVEESIVARLVLRIQLHKAPTPHKVSVSMASGQTAVCVRYMHLATLLRACALLVAQQIAYLGSAAESVLFKGDPVSGGTQAIYRRLCTGLDTRQPPNADDSCHAMAVQLWNPGTDMIPQSVTNVSEQLWHWYDQSAFMCRQALPAQIKAYKACECGRQRKTPHVFSAAAACHRAPAQALTCEHALYQYGGYKPYQLKLRWPVRSDDSAWHDVLTFFHEDKDLDTYTYDWWLRFHILWETAWESAVHRGHSVDFDRLQANLKKAIENQEIQGGTVGSVLSRCDEFEKVEPDWSLNTIVMHEDYIIVFGMQVYAEEQSGDKENDGTNPWTHLFYVLLLSCRNRLGKEKLRTIHRENIEDADSRAFTQRVAMGMQTLAATDKDEGGVDVSDLWRLLEPDALAHANPKPRAHNP